MHQGVKMRLKDKVAIITGGGTGLGRAIALRFAQEGARVVVNGRRPGPIDEVAAQIIADGGQARAVAGDVTVGPDVERLVAEATAAFGALDILVNNAGIMVSRTPVSECSEADWSRMMDGNLTAVFRCSKAALPELRKARGNIVNIASIAGLRGFPNLAAYTTCKAGIVSLTKGMALDCAKDRVRVNAVCPAYVETDFTREFLNQLRRAGTFDALVARHPLGLGQPEDVACAALYLASDEARWVTGVALPVDGGIMAGS
jgi:NAD(P)-dependent dehydrogenase (short-subunit alcohol dehydrogenase family)